MKIVKVAVSAGRTINLGNYQTTRPAVTLEAELSANEKPVEVVKKLHLACEKLLDDMAVVAKKRAGSWLDETEKQEEPPL